MFETGFTKGPCSATISLLTCCGLALVPSMFALLKTFFVSFVLFVEHQYEMLVSILSDMIQ
jgi:hypothetical protein